MSDVKILRITQRETFEDGEAQDRYIVEWKAGDDGPFFNEFPVDGFDEVQVRQQLEDRARKLSALRGP